MNDIERSVLRSPITPHACVMASTVTSPATPCTATRILAFLSGAQQVVTLAIVTGLPLHTECVARLAQIPITHWTTVPSSKGRPGPHPFHEAVKAFAPGSEVVAAILTTSGTRETTANMFTLPPLPPAAHLLILDDTWTTGAHTQSLALTARAAGARIISILAASRWINPSYAENRTFINQRH